MNGFRINVHLMPQTELGLQNWRHGPRKKFSRFSLILSHWFSLPCAKLPPPPGVNSRDRTPTSWGAPGLGTFPVLPRGLKVLKDFCSNGGRILGIYLGAQTRTSRRKFKLFSSISAGNPILFEGMALGTQKNPSVTLSFGYNAERITRQWDTDLLGPTLCPLPTPVRGAWSRQVSQCVDAGTGFIMAKHVVQRMTVFDKQMQSRGAHFSQAFLSTHPWKRGVLLWVPRGKVTHPRGVEGTVCGCLAAHQYPLIICYLVPFKYALHT